jgi:hypothetical protein
MKWIDLGLNGLESNEKIGLYLPEVKALSGLFDRQMPSGDELHTLFALGGKLHP